MGIDMPITKEKIRNHFHYGFWQYIVLIIAAIFFWNLLFTTTRYQTPNNRKVELYAEGYETEETKAVLENLIARIHQEVMPDMEEVSYQFLMLDDVYGPMQLTVWATAGQGDVYLLTKENFQRMAGSGGMLDLQPMIDDGSLNVNGLDISSGIVRIPDTGERIQLGIPADSLTGLTEAGLATKGAFFAVLVTGENQEESVRFLNYLLTHMRNEV